MIDWNPLNILDMFKGVKDLASELIVDKDKAAQFSHELDMIAEQVYMAELSAKTVPWVDAVHKMGRQILSLLNIVIPAVLLYHNPEINPLSLAALAGPSGAYIWMKGKGQ